jgi:hypothetical protein
MSPNTAPRRTILVIWDWDKGVHPIGPARFDEWRGDGIADLLVRVDQPNSEEILNFLTHLIAQHLEGGRQVLAFLHANARTHRYDAKGRDALFEQFRGSEHLRRLKINLFSGGRLPLYHDGLHKGFLGGDGNFADEAQDSETGAKTKLFVVKDADEKLLYAEPFGYVWANYWVGTRQKIYSLMENFRLWADAFDRANHTRFTQHFRSAPALLWPQLVLFTENKSELEKLPAKPLPELTDFSHCEQHLALAYDHALAEQYRAARIRVQKALFEKTYKTPSEADAAIADIVNTLDALQCAIPEALSYDTIAVFPR